MKNSFKLFAVLTVFLVFASGYALAQQNVLSNSGFETRARAAAGNPQNWTIFTSNLGGEVAERRDNGTDPATNDAKYGVDTGTHCFEINAFGGPAAPHQGGCYQDVFGVSEGATVTFNGRARTDNLAGGSFGRLRIEFYDTAGTQLQVNNSANITAVNAAGAYTTFTVTASAPFDAAYCRFVCATDATAGGGGDIDFDTFTATITGGTSNPAVFPENYQFPVNLSAVSNRSGTKLEAKKGDVITIISTLSNSTAIAINNIQLAVDLPAGFDLVDGSVQIGLGGTKAPTAVNYREDPALITIGTIPAGGTATVAFQVVVGAGAKVNNVYDMLIWAFNRLTGIPVSAQQRITIYMVPDPVFDQGTIIGKVFNDRNENGVQDEGELGVPKVRICTEEGWIVYTDKDGKYHIPAVNPNRHVIKVDGHTLPEGTKFITEESYLVKTTPGLLSKVNFAVRLPEADVPEKYKDEMNVIITQDFERPAPVFDININDDLVKTGYGRLEKPVVFKIDTNYDPLLFQWRIEIRDEAGNEVWTGYGEEIVPEEVVWEGFDNSDQLVEPGHYCYRFIAMDKKGREDWSSLKYFRVESKINGKESIPEEFGTPKAGYFNIMKSAKNSIPLVSSGVVKVRGNVAPNAEVRLNGRKVMSDNKGRFEKEMYVPYGENVVGITTTDVEGKSITYSKAVDVKDQFFFLVGLAEGELGYNNFKGNFEAVASDDEFEDNFYKDGRLAYYLKAKIKGKFLVSASQDTDENDTDEKVQKLFTSLDPDDYYPVYGDDSSIDYEGGDTQERFYILVEVDRSFFKFGTFNTAFDKTELATFERTLSGIKAHYETLSTTPYGDAKAGITLFSANTRQVADHNEFINTGGSLFYLRHRKVIEGSEKICVEVRDKIQDMPLSTVDLYEGADYEIDYDAGRILLTKPLISVVNSGFLIDNNILNGDKVVLIVDYEYEPNHLFADSTRGIRGWKSFGKNVVVGGTYVEDTANHPVNNPYNLRGVDATIKLGKNTRIYAEFAESELNQISNAVSYNGGLSFQNLPTGLINGRNPQVRRNEAWLVKGETKLGKNTEITGYFQHVEPYFSNANSIVQQNTKKYGICLRQRVTNNLMFTFRHDHRELANPQLTNINVVNNPNQAETTIAQIRYVKDKLDVTAEYRHQDIDVQSLVRLTSNFDQNFNDILAVNNYEDAAALRVAYRVNEWFKPFVEAQVGFNGEPNNQFSVGAEAKVGDLSTISIRQTTGSIGDGMLLQISTQPSEDTTVYTNFALIKDRDGNQTFNSSIGSNIIIDDKSRFYTERVLSSYREVANVRNIMGYQRQFTDKFSVEASYERSNVHEFVTNDVRNVVSATFRYIDPEMLEAKSKVEFRLDRGPTSNGRVYLTDNELNWYITEDLTFGGRLNYGHAINTSAHDTLGSFMEFNVGLAYRPVAHDRFNALLRYTYLKDRPILSQFLGITNTLPSYRTDEISHIVSAEGVYDINKYLQLVEKVAFKRAYFESAAASFAYTDSYLNINRLNFHITSKWDIAAEYRILLQDGVGGSLEHGALFEVDREIMDYVRVGVGYNFTKFDDNLREQSSYDRQGFFVRLTGKV